jgi:hypothetical protein
VVESFAAGLQAGHDQRDADILNGQFAADVVWGSPYGALSMGMSSSTRFMFASNRNQPALRLSGTTFATIARLALDDEGEPLAPSARSDQPFSEMAMYVLKRHDDAWWLAAGQNTPMRPGGAVPATA